MAGILDTIAKVGGAVSPVAGIVGGVLGWLSQKKQADKEKAYNNLVARLHNEWLEKRDVGVKNILDQLQARGQDIFGPQTVTSQSSTTGSTSFDETETPEVTAENQKLDALARGMLERRLSSPTGLPAGYEETGISAINASARPAEAARANLARSRGISQDLLKIGDPNERARVGQIASFRAETPLKARELQNQDLTLSEQMLQARMARRRKGRTSSQSSTTGSQTGPADYSAIADLMLPPGPRAATMT